MIDFEALRNPVSSGSHLMACGVAVVGTVFLWRMTRGAPGRRAAALCFGFSAILLYGSSAAFHGLWFESVAEHRFYQRLDQTAIYLLIAGSYTPVFVCLLTGDFRRRLLFLTWGLALTGVFTLWMLPKLPHEATVGIFLALGWIGLVPIVSLFRAVGGRAMLWAGYEAFFYTFGAICDLVRWPVLVPGWVGWHEVFHFCDVGGTAAHYLFVVRFALPYQAIPELDERSTEAIADPEPELAGVGEPAS